MNITIKRVEEEDVIVEIPDSLIRLLHCGERKPHLGDLVSLGDEHPAMVRPGWIANANPHGPKHTTLTTVRGYVIKVDEPYPEVQRKLGGVPKAEPEPADSDAA